MGYEVTGSATA